ncbi:MAG: hypothetical protein NDI61_00015 [Bdellovibrionaceae bacterium]|nr:hypothetical protein [Pseudobdellovibrionaceae bacterium]
MTANKVQQHLMFAAQSVLVAIFGISLVAALHPDARAGVRSALVKDYRVLVSSARADLIGNGIAYTVTKVKTRDSIFLEVFRPEPDGSQKLMEKIELTDARDGYFNFNGRVANLALEDIDDDGRAEILVPVFDRDLVGRLSIFKYNEGMNGFERVVR